MSRLNRLPDPAAATSTIWSAGYSAAKLAFVMMVLLFALLAFIPSNDPNLSHDPVRAQIAEAAQRKYVRDIYLSPDGRQAMIVRHPTSFQYLDLASGCVTDRYYLPSGFLSHLHATQAFGNAIVYVKEAGVMYHSVRPLQPPVMVVPIRNGHELIAATPAHSLLGLSRSQTLEVWSIPTATMRHSVDLGCAASQLVWSDNGRHLLVVLSDGGLRVYDGESLTLEAAQSTGLMGGGRACWSSDGETIAAFNASGNVVFWDWQRDRVESRQTDSHLMLTGTLTPDGKIFAYSGNENQLCFIECFTNAEPRQLGPAGSRINVLRFTADGSALLVGGVEGNLEYWDVADGSLMWAVSDDTPVSMEAS